MNKMASQVQLLHNDDTVLDPADPSLRERGTVMVDGREWGNWESHRSGSWTACQHHDTLRLEASSKEALEAAIASHS